MTTPSTQNRFQVTLHLPIIICGHWIVGRSDFLKIGIWIWQAPQWLTFDMGKYLEGQKSYEFLTDFVFATSGEIRGRVEVVICSS